MRDLNYAFKQLCLRHCDGSFAVQADRQHILDRCATQLRELGYRNLCAENLKPKHVMALVTLWRADGLSAGTLKNRMSALRWLAERLDKANIVERSNAAYGIPDRMYVTNESKAQELDSSKLEQITDRHVVLSLRLQEAFGLRREESIKFVPAWADRGDHLLLKGSWTKGGREREIPVRTIEQRQLLDEAKSLAEGKSLVAPGYRSYRDYLAHFRYLCERVGIHHLHGHRHEYSQARYLELTGWACPARGGPSAKQLTPAQKVLDQTARLTISHELGHGRVQIAAVYLGR